MSNKEFKLSQTLYGHSLDVRSLAVTSHNDIISGSRDKTAKCWKFNSFQNTFEEIMTYKDQKNFVASVLYLDPTEEFPDGLIITGGNDNLILVYKPSEPFATFTIKDHTNTVSCLGKTNEPNSFLSGSWDTTAKYIKISGTPNCLVTYTGHAAAVWSVLQLGDGRIATASADKTIGIWSHNGQKIVSLTGHTDCVRSLADFPEQNIFMSVANDASIKVWSYAGENINTYYGPTNYIYCIARCKPEGPNCFVTSDEDRTVMFWENGECKQKIKLPAQSVWAVACLFNGDIVTGSSDGVVRVFTRDESRYADEMALTKFAEEVEALERQSMQEIGGVKVSDLPGKEALYDPGKRNGQMKMIREDGKVIAYTWIQDGDNSHWEKVGDVMGGTDKDSSGKTTYEGKSYDFVFSVDVEDGKPPLKLPYNKGDDVYRAAHAFLTKNFLPAEYLEQVVDFILKNSKEQYVPPASEYQDPFTGGNRYTPTYQDNSGQVGVNVDPFTGGSSYATSSTKPASSSTSISSGGNADPFTGGSSYTTNGSSSTFFPVTSYRTFDSGDPTVILKKLKEFNSQLPDNNKASESDLESLVKICGGSTEDRSSYEVLFRLLMWPEDKIFPVLDILRMAVRHEINNREIVRMHDGGVIEGLKRFISGSNKVPNNTIVALRALCNLCVHEDGENLIFDNRFDIVENLTSLSQLNKNGQIALSTLLLNLTVMSVKKNDDLGYSILSQVLPDILTKMTDPESHFRGYVAIGTLVTGANSHKHELVAKINENQNFSSTLQLHSFGGNDSETKRSHCVKQLKGVL
ncbi:phospholipase A-2-activating protein [Anthonomus grandis grandis]|uniref:phospholipase A-2-activating protein n=1 Tax=Anthonomus grandis grandis TaxID=2921223 RepID=UPI002165DC70|nr:phospholipase A-2-activating protein [Anthonomus grandis grandis]